MVLQGAKETFYEAELSCCSESGSGVIAEAAAWPFIFNLLWGLESVRGDGSVPSLSFYLRAAQEG